MNEPKKYILNHIPGAFKMDDHWMHPQDNRMTPAPAGDYVRYEDYARLKAEVERLTKVGDKMADYLFDAPYPCRIFWHKWKDAKEGKQP